MKVGIVTVFYTENCGSVLQATALQKILVEHGCDVYFISTKNRYSAHSLKKVIKNCGKSFLMRKNFLKTFYKYLSFKKYFRSNFTIISPKNTEFLDLIIIGSDTVWDITSKYFLESQELFWGLKWKTIPMITYAATIANSPYTLLDNKKYPLEACSNYQKISVRDKYTKEYIETRTKKIIPIVCDPTLLCEVQYYREKCRKVPFEKYLLLYLFNEPDKSFALQIQSFSKRMGYKIVAIGRSISFAEIYIEASIENFLSYFNAASYIITNTFHGTVFSIIFNKNFIVLD